MPRYLPALLLLLPLTVSLTMSTKAGAVEVVASIRPLALIADAVMAGRGQARQLVPDGASSHEYALRPSDRALLARADLVLWVGPVHEQFLGSALRGKPVITAQTLPGIALLPARRLADAMPVAGTTDPHLWLSPANAATVARALALELSRRDAGGASLYRRNADTFTTRMQQLQDGLHARFASLHKAPLIAYHDAYQYFEQSAGLLHRGSLTPEPEQKPGARHVLEMAQRVQKEGIACLLSEPGADTALAARIFGRQAYRVAAVDELFVGVPRGPEGYAAGLQNMAGEIQRCLTGKP